MFTLYDSRNVVPLTLASSGKTWLRLCNNTARKPRNEEKELKPWKMRDWGGVIEEEKNVSSSWILFSPLDPEP